jgi:AraC-like DNA-binding protein
MRSVSYYRKESGNGDVNEYASSPPILVNCAGILNTDAAFETNNISGRHDHYFMYIVTGELSFVSIGETVTAGQYVIIPAGSPYHYQHESGKEVKYLWVHFTGGDAGALMERLAMQKEKAVTICTALGSDEKLLSYHSAILEELAKQDDNFDVGCSGFFYNMLLRASRLSHRRADPFDDTSKAIRSAVIYIHQNFDRDIRITDMARMANLSESRFRTLFKNATDQAPLSYLNNYRLTQACRLLTQNDIPISRVSTLVGFEDPLYFSRLFRKHYGISPKSYRKSYGKDI